jgi:hypothetical protein
LETTSATSSPTPARRLLKGLVFTATICSLVAAAFVHLTVVGVTRQNISDWDAFSTALHGWPAPFAEHKGEGPCADGARAPLPLSDKLSSFHISSVTSFVCDALLYLLLIAATGTVALRLWKRGVRRWQFSIGDMFSLIATTSMVLGLVCLDDRLSLGEYPVVEDMYLRLRDLPLFDRVMTLFAIACAVWLIVSTVIARLGEKSAKKQP